MYTKILIIYRYINPIRENKQTIILSKNDFNLRL